jgi:hypothetical protein
MSAEDAGVVLGSLAWVLGALEIMKDRGHAAADEELHELYDSLAPKLNRSVALISGGRAALGPESPLQASIESAYAEVRAAFERWIALTASDTAQVAIGQRLAAALDTLELPDATQDSEGDSSPSTPRSPS